MKSQFRSKIIRFVECNQMGPYFENRIAEIRKILITNVLFIFVYIKPTTFILFLNRIHLSQGSLLC